MAAGGGHRLSAGAHVDRYTLASNRYLTSNWLVGAPGVLDLRAAGRTRTAGLWAQDAWSLGNATLTVGGRYEWWKADRGVNISRSPAIAAVQPVRSAEHFSPKATLAYALTPAVTARLSYGEAWRFPTVGELYQVVTTPVPAVPNPNLKPEHARSVELAIEHRDAHGNARLSLFGEGVTDALLSQTGALNGTDRRSPPSSRTSTAPARAVSRQRWSARTWCAAIDVQGERHLHRRADPRQGHRLSGRGRPCACRRCRAGRRPWSALGDRTPGVALTAAGRYASRMYGTLDGSDVDRQHLSAASTDIWWWTCARRCAAGEHLTFGLGVDNVGNDRYFLFHPFPQRTFQADVRWKL